MEVIDNSCGPGNAMVEQKTEEDRDIMQERERYDVEQHVVAPWDESVSKGIWCLGSYDSQCEHKNCRPAHMLVYF